MSEQAQSPTPPTPPTEPRLVDTDRTPPRQRQTRGPLPSVDMMESLEESLIDFGIDVESLDPSMHYYLAQDRPQRINKLRGRLGYRPVSRSMDGVRLHEDSAAADQGSAEDLIRVGDTILMCCPRGRYEERREKNLARANARLTGPEASFRKKARKDAIDIVEDDGRIRRTSRSR